MISSFSKRAIEIIKRIPVGKVVTYGQVATFAGNNRGARQVSRILHSSSEKYELPWHRVINSQGRISMKPGDGFEMQKSLLEVEGIEFDGNNQIDFKKFLWKPLD